MNKYTANTTVRLSVAITLAATGAAFTPDSVALTVREPDGVVVPLASQVVTDATGKLHADYTPTKMGLHAYEWVGTGSLKVAARGQFLVNQGTF